MVIDAMAATGYDYATCHVPGFGFATGERDALSTVSLNEGAVIKDWESFDRYVWPDPSSAGFSILEQAAHYLPEGMKLMVMGPGGVLENVIGLVGYENLCYLIYDEPELVQAVFDQVGSRMVQYYEGAASIPTVGFLSSNDDWGFNRRPSFVPRICANTYSPGTKRSWRRRIATASPVCCTPAAALTRSLTT